MEVKSMNVTAEEAIAQFPALLREVMEGREVEILFDGAPVARLVPAERTGGKRGFGSAKGLFTMSDDFDEPLEDFKPYMR